MAGPNAITASNMPDRRYTAVIPVPVMANFTNSTTIKMAIPHAFRVDLIGFRVGGKVGAGTGATATLTGQISGTAMTGGVTTPTLANTATAGSLIAGTAITGNNIGAAGATLEVAVSSVTAFTAGDGWIEATIVDTSQGAMAF